MRALGYPAVNGEEKHENRVYRPERGTERQPDGVITLRDSLAYMGFDAEKTKAVEARLHAIENN